MDDCRKYVVTKRIPDTKKISSDWLPVGLYLIFLPPTFLCFFLYQKPAFVGLGSKFSNRVIWSFFFQVTFWTCRPYVVSNGVPVFL